MLEAHENCRNLLDAIIYPAFGTLRAQFASARSDGTAFRGRNNKDRQK